MGVVLLSIAGDEVEEEQVWALVHHSSETSDLPPRLRRMMDSAMCFVELEEEGKQIAKQKSLPTKRGEMLCTKQQKSKISRIVMKDEVI